MKKMILRGANVLLVLSMLCLSGCTKDAGTQGGGTAQTAYTFTDDLGRSVTVDHPQRVAVISGSFAQTWLLAGGTLNAVTEDACDERKLELGPEVVHLGALKSPDMEKLLEAETDFVILSANIAKHVELRPILERAGIPFAYFDVETFDDYLSMLRICTAITGDKESYEKNGAAVREQINQAIARKKDRKAPTVLFIRAFSSGARAKGSDNMTGAMLKDLGCVNIADSENSLLEDLNMEKIIEQDPDFIFVTTMGESDEKAMEQMRGRLLSNPAWKELSAVKNERYVLLPKELFHLKPNARWGESYEMLAEILYGEK